MEIKTCGTIETKPGPETWFSGTVWHERLVEPTSPARAAVGLVRFAPGGRTAWHTHPLGQTLYVVAGTGRAQSWGGPVRIIRAGDVVQFAPGEKHWHGAGPTTLMEHIAIQESVDGKAVDWLEYVSADQYAVNPE